MAKKKSPKQIALIGCAFFLGLLVFCVAGVAIIDALNLAPDTPTPVAQQAAAILPDATPTETTQP
ncbi:MAG: hypothetical protein ROW52_05755, partial [Anaerolineaceae bacterium]